MDANQPIIPNLDELARKLRDASVEHDDGKRYIRASVAARIIGISPSLGVYWARRGFVNALKIKVPSQPGAVRGVVVAWPVDDTITTARAYWSGRRKWSSLDDDHLLERLGLVPIERVAAELGRTVKAVRFRANMFGINQRNAQGEWTTCQVAKILGTNLSRVIDWCGRKNNPLRHRRLSDRPRTRLIREDRLRSFLVENQDIYNSLPANAKPRIDRLLMSVSERRKAVAA